MTVANLTRRWTWVLVAAIAALGAQQARGDSFLLVHANVVWVQGNRVYIASRDSVTFPPATQLSFRYRDNIVAIGEVTAVYQSELIAAVVTSGSLGKVKQFNKVEITARPPEFRPPTLIRVGYPAPGRKNLLFDCTRLEPDTTVLQGAYRPELFGRGLYRFVRDPSYAVARAQPDTLVVRMFDEAADEEIALERGDIDVAVFWPGEASTHIREVADQRFGGREGLYLIAAPSHRGPPRPGMPSDRLRDALDNLNLSLFHGDLPRRGGWQEGGKLEPAGYEIDPGIPGRDVLQRFLNATVRTETNPDSTIAIRLWLEVRDEWGLRMDPVNETTIVPRSAVLFSPGLRSYMAKVDVDAVVRLFTCLPSSATR